MKENATWTDDQEKLVKKLRVFGVNGQTVLPTDLNQDLNKNPVVKETWNQFVKAVEARKNGRDGSTFGDHQF